MATDGQLSFVSFRYGDIEWGEEAEIGFNAGDGERAILVPVSLTNSTIDIENMTNIGQPGVFLYRVDFSADVQDPPYGT